VFFYAPLAQADFSADGYGQCAYGRSCPTEPNNPASPSTPTAPFTPTTPTTPGTPDTPSSPQDPGDTETNQADDETPGAPNNSNNNNTGTTTGRGSSQQEGRTKSANILQRIGDFTLEPVRRFIERMPAPYRLATPYTSWLFLIILSFALLILAAIDKRRTNQLITLIKKLQAMLQEQKNFLRLALHHLNTPLAATKSAIELIQLGGSNADVGAQLKPIGLQLDASVGTVANALANEHAPEAISNKAARQTSLVNLLQNIHFLLPVSVAIIFAWFLYAAVGRTDTRQPDRYLLVQIVTAFVVIVIFINALRIYRLSRDRQITVQQISELYNQTKEQRSKLVNTLHASLGVVVSSITKAVTELNDQKLAGMLAGSASSIALLALKIELATTTTISNPEECRTRDIIEKAIADQQAVITDKKLTIQPQLTDDIVRIPVQEASFAIQAVIQNAIDFSANEDAITITSNATREALTISVQDTGPGIAPANLEKIFQPFSQANDVLTYDHDGMGLSLFAAYAALQRVGGSLSINSVAGKGTTATITVPITFTAFEAAPLLLIPEK
jgi:signal transduction histidine kinase